MAGDHGVTEEAVSAYPPEVTHQMVANFLNRGAAINVLARQTGTRVIVVDMGVATELPQRGGLISRKVARGTRNMKVGPAMTVAEAEDALASGCDVAEREIASGLDIVATGEMGIGNTTAASAVVAALTGQRVEDVTGRGTGVDDEGVRRKVAVIEEAIAVNQPDSLDAFDVLRKLGGFEIAGLVGVMLTAASKRVPVVLDGFISGAAALVAVGLAPRVKPYLIAAHRSVEPGHAEVLRHLGLRPLLDLELRLGEGTGAVLALPIIEAAARLLNEMATFAEAGVSGCVEASSESLVEGDHG